jgi:CheY-like chemotaxis protein
MIRGGISVDKPLLESAKGQKKRSSPSKGTVLLIDDDEWPTRFYETALERRDFKVERCTDPDTAYEFARENTESLQAIVLDMMMPAGERYKNRDTADGLKTGLMLYQDLSEIIKPNLPVVVLTNVSNHETLKLLPEGGRLRIAEKLDVPPLEFAILVEEMVDTAAAKAAATDR